MDDRQLNFVRAGIISVGVLALCLGFQYQMLYDIQVEQLAQLKEDCKEPTCTFTYTPILPNVVMAVPAVFAFFISLRYFENKRLRTWRSYR